MHKVFLFKHFKNLLHEEYIKTEFICLLNLFVLFQMPFTCVFVLF